MNLLRYLPLFILTLLISCEKEESFDFVDLIQSQDGIIKDVLENKEVHEIQIKCSVILDDKKGGKTQFIENEFFVDNNKYHYPASTVKLPVAILALEKTNALDGVLIDTPYKISSDTVTHTLRSDIEEIFSISGNAPYNRLLAFVGYEQINKRLNEVGLNNTRISHKLSESGSAADQFDTLKFLTDSGTINVHNRFKKRDDFEALEKDGLLKGKGFVRNDSLIKGSFDFSQRNYYSIGDIHETLRRIYFPDNFSTSELFKLNPQQLSFLRSSMTTLPRQLGYDTTEYYDSYGKFFVYGDSKKPIPSHIKIHNKVGYAYGTLTDSAYFVDEKNNIAFILSATILVNDNGIFNDSVYEYDKRGIPFLAELGGVVHAELLRLKE